ncbi:MAG TPA: hypothetical protein VJ982_03080 [Gemmatimonadota bacterium]|nr:hypothetical protein [Gemmatimonadota bacterium]
MSPSRPPDDAAPAIRCPHCGSADLELAAAFGGSLMSRQFYCRGCRTVFEWIKWESGGSSDWLR